MSQTQKLESHRRTGLRLYLEVNIFVLPMSAKHKRYLHKYWRFAFFLRRARPMLFVFCYSCLSKSSRFYVMLRCDQGVSIIAVIDQA